MYVTVVYVSVKPQHRDDFIQACEQNHNQSIEEAGNRRFDILQMQQDPNQFILYEAYDSQAQAAAHKDTAHYAKWRETVADWMAEPRKGVVYNGLLPQ